MKSILTYIFLLTLSAAYAQQVPDSVMHHVYEQIKTPHKYGLVLTPSDDSKKLDCLKG